MLVEEWIDRLNLPQYIKKFKGEGFRRLSDLEYFSEDLLDQFEITDIIHRKRIMWMLEGDSEVVENFAYQSIHQCRTIISKFLKKKNSVEKVLINIPPNTLTGF